MWTKTCKRVLPVLTVALLMPALGWADAGEGLHAGNLVLSPGVTLSGGFDSNVFFLSEEEVADTISAPSVQLAPFLSIESQNPVNLHFGFDGRVAWRQYVRPDSATVQAQSGLSADVGAQATLNPGGDFSLKIEDRLVRTNEPPSDPAAFSYNRLTNRIGATAGIHPGGRVFQHYLSYDWLIYRHNRLEEIDRMVHDFTLQNYWRFLPKTAFFLGADFQMIRYDQPDRQIGEGTFTNVNSNPLRVTGGLTGLITNRLALRMVGGYGWAFYEVGPSFSGLLVDTQLQYLFGAIAEKNKLFVGYERGFMDTTIASFASHHRPYAGYHQGFANQRLRFSLEVSTVLRDYVGVPAGTFTTEVGDVVVPEDLNDTLVLAEAETGFYIRKWWTLDLSYHFSANFTDDRITTTTPAGDVLRDYVRHFVSFGTTVRY